MVKVSLKEGRDNESFIIVQLYGSNTDMVIDRDSGEELQVSIWIVLYEIVYGSDNYLLLWDLIRLFGPEFSNINIIRFEWCQLLETS